MDASSLAKDLDNLEKSWSSLDSWLNFWTILVVVGVAVELLVIITEYAHDWQDFRRGTIHSPGRPSILVFGFGFLGAALVAIGVAGEFRIHVKAGKIESDMRSKSRELVGIAQHDAAGANREAGQLRKDAEGLKKAAEDEKLARVTIEARVAWRRLTDRQKTEIGAALGQRFSNQGVSFWYSAGDAESSWFASDLAEAARAAHTLRVYPPGAIMSLMESGRPGDPIRRSLTGVRVQSTRDERSRQLADAIIHELIVRGFDAARPTDPDSNPVPQVWVNVDHRPDGPQGEFKLAAQKQQSGAKK
jgi:hypothetical protein